MAKDSQIDKKEVRLQKSKGNPVNLASEEGKNENRTLKKQSIKEQGFQSQKRNN